MKGLAVKQGNRHWYLGLLVMLLSVAGLMSTAVMAQQATANVNGVVKDPSGAAIANAQVALTNVNTGVVRTTTTNSDGVYDFPSVVPGVYSMQASATGFSSVSQPPVTLQVGQTAAFDFQLKVGTAQASITVTAVAPALETATAELGTVVPPNQMNDLPLNGRNFTQLLTITPGVANLNTDQNSGGGGGWNGESIGSFSFPAVNGARNRSNAFVLDGSNDLNTLAGTYNYAPIVDDIQEFKVNAHNDLAEYGASAGAIVAVASKSGTNQYHGDLWEFVRNSAMNSIGYFNTVVPPLRTNQFGAGGGGPLSIPKLYNGKNRTFFYAAFEAYKSSNAQEGEFLGPTNAQRGGDFSAMCTSGFAENGVCNDRDADGNIAHQLYDPATTVTSSTTGYARTPFAGNIVPTTRFNPISVLYQSIMPPAGAFNSNGTANVYLPLHTSEDQYSGTMRFDQNFGNNNQVMFRYSQFNLTEANPQGNISTAYVHVYGHNYIGHWTHTFSPTTFSDVYFGRNYGYTVTGSTNAAEDAASFTSQLASLGMGTFFETLGPLGLTAPQYGADGFGEEFCCSQLQASGLADDWQWGGSFSKILGRHTLKAGGDFQTNNFTSPIYYSSEQYGVAQTQGWDIDPTTEKPAAVGGESWASLLLGIPESASYRNIDEVVHNGWIDGVYVQDQWKATPRLTVNLGFRNDFVITPIYGTGNGANYYTGEADPITGQYILNAQPPACSATQFAPCIPTGIYTASSTPAPGGLPAHAVVSPTTRMINNSLGDWAARLGLAYRLNDKTVLRGGYGRSYDAWATIVQLSQNFGGNWPSLNTLDNSGLNVDAMPSNTVYANDPLQLGSTGLYPINDFSQVSQWMVDPNFRTPYFDQWNAGIERQLPANIALDAEYVGSNGRHEDWGPTLNTPPPGAGNVASRRPYPYMQQQWFDQSVGDSRYNALEVSATERPTHGVSFLVSYTLAQANADGCNLGASCDSSNPYDRKMDYGTADLNQKNVFSAAFTAQSPFDKSPNKLVANVAGGWALNGIVQVTSGQPYTVTLGGDPENVGCCLQERPNVTGNPNSGSHTPSQWFNTSAFAVTTGYTYGNEKVNLMTGQHWNDVDMSLFRQFHIGLGEERYFEFRAESFNLFNNVVFGAPDATNTDSNYGKITYQWNPARELQMSLKFYF